MNLAIFTVASLVSGCQGAMQEGAFSPILSVPAHVIYGEDGRLDLHEVNDLAWRERVGSTVALIGAERLADLKNGTTSIRGVSFAEANQLCESEPFFDQMKVSHCSGFLVAPDVVVTAGHCVPTRTDCEVMRFVFGYTTTSEGQQPDSILTQDVYGCGKLLRTGLFPDFAVVKLDRPVVGRQPLPLSRSSELKSGDPLVVIGHPMGLPAKISMGASVRTVSAATFLAESDTYRGSSGSAVFNATTGEVEGVLVKGEADFVEKDGCFVSKRCADGECSGEGATRISEILRFLEGDTGDPPVDDPLSGIETREFEAAGIELEIPNADPNGVESAIQVNEAPEGRRVYVSIDITHTYRGDLRLSLITPTGREFVLKNEDFFDSSDDLVGIFGVNFDSFQDLEELSSMTETGKWTLKVVDTAPSDFGTLESWSVIFAKH